MGLYTFSLDDKKMEKFDQKVESGKKSQKIEELITQFIGDEDQEIGLKFADFHGLTNNREQLAKEVLDQDKTMLEPSQFFKNKVRKKAIYTQKESYKQALNALNYNDDLPIKFDDGQIISGEKKCACGVTLTSKVLEKHENKCPNCSQKYRINI